MFTFWVYGMLLITLWQLEGLIRQARTIWTKRSAQSVSGIFFAYFLLALLNMVVYAFVGNAETNTTLLINGSLQFIVVIIIFLGWIAYELKKQNRIMRKYFLPAFFLALISVIALITLLPADQKPIFVVILTIFGIPSLVTQIAVLWKHGRGDIELRMLLPQCAANVYLAVFAFATGEAAFKLIGPTFALLFCLNIVVWLKQKSREA